MTEVKLPEPVGFRPDAAYTAEQMQFALIAEREGIAQSVEKLIAGWDGPYRRSGDLIVLAIRKGT